MSVSRVSKGICSGSLRQLRFSSYIFARHLSTQRLDVDRWRDTEAFKILTRRPEVMKALEDVVVAYDKAGIPIDLRLPPSILRILWRPAVWPETKSLASTVNKEELRMLIMGTCSVEDIARDEELYKTFSSYPEVKMCNAVLLAIPIAVLGWMWQSWSRPGNSEIQWPVEADNRNKDPAQGDSSHKSTA